MKQKDPVVDKLTIWTMYLVFGLFAAVVMSGAVWALVAIWRRILGG